MDDLQKFSIPQTEILLVGSFYKNPDLYIEWGQYIRSKYDFYDEATKFFYECFELMYKTLTQTFNQININTFMSQDEDRLKTYKKYGGYKIIETWSNLATPDDFKNYYNSVKKYSLLRECYRNGYPAEKIRNYKKFDEMSASEVYKILRSKLDNIHTVVLANEDSVNIADGMTSSILQCIETPDIGLQMPYNILSDVFKGIRTQTMLVMGMLSNEGKTRFLAKLAAYIAFVHKEKVCIMLNETTEKEIRHCIMTTVLNNPEFQELHGVRINKDEKEITLGRYRDSEGNFINRKHDGEGNYTESLEEFQARLHKESEEFRQVLRVAEWVEQESEGTIYVKELQEYSDETLEFEIRKHKLTKNIKYFCYDTLKSDNDSIGEWAALKRTTTMLSELSKEIDIFMYGSIQLTDEAVHLNIFDLTSMNIANSKQIKHLLDQLCLAKRVPKTEYHKYKYIPTEAWGEPIPLELNQKKVYYGCRVDKNRQGEKPTVLFEVDLNRNTWFEVGTLVNSGNSKK